MKTVFEKILFLIFNFGLMISKIFYFLFFQDLVKYIFDDPRKRMDISLLWVYSTYLKLRKRQLKLEQLVSVKTDDEMPDEDFSLEYERIIQEIGDIQMEYDNVLFKIFYGLQQRQEQKDM